MFFLMLWNTYLVFAGVRDLGQAVTLLWTFKLPWNWAYHGTLFHPGVAAVRLRLLRRHAHIHSLGANHHGAVQAPQLVCLLPHGHHDTADLQSKEQPHMTVPYHAAQSCNCRACPHQGAGPCPGEPHHALALKIAQHLVITSRWVPGDWQWPHG